jgi:hypothetical protein
MAASGPLSGPRRDRAYCVARSFFRGSFMAGTRRRLAVVGAVAVIALVVALALVRLRSGSGDDATPAASGPSQSSSSGSPASGSRASGSPGASVLASPTGTVNIVAAGDIACLASAPVTTQTCRQKDTSDLVLALAPDAVLTLGDEQYEAGALSAFRSSYDSTWGRFKAITKPAPGNHEYGTAAAKGYFDYFGAAVGEPGKGWYSYDLGAWHLVALNSNCNQVQCGRGSEQERWLRQDLAAHPNVCTLAYWHHPRWSHGEHGDSTRTAALVEDLYAAGADLILVGHDHTYERFAPLNPAGARDGARGVRQIVVGTGGRSHYRLAQGANTEASNNTSFGVLSLALAPAGYSWRFAPVPAASYTDSGTASCH